MKNYLSIANSKLRKDNIAVFGIPAFRSKEGESTCPNASACIKGCYARQGAYVWSNVAAAYETRYQLTKSPEFVSTINAELKRRKSIKIVRIHDSGDFYSVVYLLQWLQVIKCNPTIKFYTYTKMIDMFQNRDIIGICPSNLKVIYSYGGKQDVMISNELHSHSRVFNSLADLKREKYIDCSVRDINVFKGNKIGLIYHGAESKRWISK